MHTDYQVMLLRWLLQNGSTQREAAKAAGMSVRSARKWQRGELPSESKKERDWRTRADPLGEVWETEIRPFLNEREGMPSGMSLLRMLEARHPGRFDRRHLRTLQRRMHQVKEEWAAKRSQGPQLTECEGPVRPQEIAASPKRELALPCSPPSSTDAGQAIGDSSWPSCGASAVIAG